MLQCVINGFVLKAGVIDRHKQNKPNLNYVDMYIEGDGGTHRIFKVPDSYVDDFLFGQEKTFLINSYVGEREYLSFVMEIN